MARVLVTGATGFIGRHFVKHLLERGDGVRCLIHQKEERVADAECVPGDITVPQTLAQAVEDVDIVYHLAGATVVTSSQRYRPINSLGTRNLGETCARLAHPPTLVYLSSLAAAGPTIPNQPRREEDPPAPVSEYGRSKLLAERLLRNLAGRLPVTILRPPGVFGPGDPNMISLFKIARLGFNFIPGSMDQQLGLIYVEDLVHALPQAAQLGERLLDRKAGLNHPQGIYFVAMEERPTLEDLGHLAANALGPQRDVFGEPRSVSPRVPLGPLGERRGVSPPVTSPNLPVPSSVRSIVIPPWIGKIMARTNDFLARLTMQPMLLTSDKMREALAGSWICSSAKAKHAWGFSCRVGLADGLQKTVAWYQQQGLL